MRTENYWYVCLSGGDNFAVDDENAEKLKAAIVKGLPLVEIIDTVGATEFVVVAHIIKLDESTPALRDATWRWNRDVDEEIAERKRKWPKPTELE